MTTKNPRQKQIKLSHIQSNYKKINKMETHTLDAEQNLVIKFYPIFPEHKIEELLKELHASITYAEENALDFFQSDEQFYKYLYLLIIRKMTSLESEISEDFPTQISILNQILDIGLVRTIFDEVLDGNEVTKVFDRVDEMVVNVTRINEATQKELAKLDKLENKDILLKSTNQPFNVLASPTDGMLQ